MMFFMGDRRTLILTGIDNQLYKSTYMERTACKKPFDIDCRHVPMHIRRS